MSMLILFRHEVKYKTDPAVTWGGGPRLVRQEGPPSSSSNVYRRWCLHSADESVALATSS
eukprot:37144-Amphidinium_carterae.1